MLKKLRRLKKNRDFSRVFKRSKKVKTDNLLFNIAQVSPYCPSRFGFVVANSIDKRATRRNGIKRRMRAAIRELLPGIKNGYDVIISVKKPFDYPYKLLEIKNQIRRGLFDAGLL
jgi:ribonuclease P protein component